MLAIWTAQAVQVCSSGHDSLVKFRNKFALISLKLYFGICLKIPHYNPLRVRDCGVFRDIENISFEIPLILKRRTP